MLYDILDPEPHSLLSEKALGLGPGDETTRLEAQIELAESLLRLDEFPVQTDATTVAKIRRFLALQVNWQVEIGLDPLYIKSQHSTHTAQGVTYRDNLVINPQVAAGVKRLIRGLGFSRALRSLRG